MKTKLKILITGPVPPPAGGISIHIQRLGHLLKDDFDIDFVDESDQYKEGVFNMRKLQVWAYFRKVRAADVLFVHSGNKLFKKIHILVGRLFGKKVIITLHGYGARRKQPFRTIDSLIFRMADKIVLVNAEIANRVSLPADKCIVKHAFLPPVMLDEPALPTIVTDWVRNARVKNETVICANASRLDIYNKQDLYGLDMSIEVTDRLVKKGEAVSFIYTVSSLENCLDTFNSSKKLIADLGLNNRFMLINERLSFVKLIEKADIVIRPSNTDGDALTVREAIFLGKSTLASDIVERPAGTVTFKTRDIADLEEKLEKLVKIKRSDANEHGEQPNVSNEDFRAFYFNLINSVTLK